MTTYSGFKPPKAGLGFVAIAVIALVPVLAVVIGGFVKNGFGDRFSLTMIGVIVLLGFGFVLMGRSVKSRAATESSGYGKTGTGIVVSLANVSWSIRSNILRPRPGPPNTRVTLEVFPRDGGPSFIGLLGLPMPQEKCPTPGSLVGIRYKSALTTECVIDETAPTSALRIPPHRTHARLEVLHHEGIITYAEYSDLSYRLGER